MQLAQRNTSAALQAPVLSTRLSSPGCKVRSSGETMRPTLAGDSAVAAAAAALPELSSKASSC